MSPQRASVVVSLTLAGSTSTVNPRFDNLVATSTLQLAGERSISFVYERDLVSARSFFEKEEAA